MKLKSKNICCPVQLKIVLLACKRRSTTGVTAAGMSTGVPDCKADWVLCFTGRGALLTTLSSGSDTRWPCSRSIIIIETCT